MCSSTQRHCKLIGAPPAQLLNGSIVALQDNYFLAVQTAARYACCQAACRRSSMGPICVLANALLHPYTRYLLAFVYC